MIYTIRTTVGRERSVIDTLSNRAKNVQADVKAIFHPQELRGYIFIEGDSEGIDTIISGVPHVRGLIRKEVKIEELKKFLEEKQVEINVNVGDIIEVIGGPFKNERGKVTRVDTAKSEVTIELLEAAIPIPITVAIDSIRVVESEDKKEE